MAHILLFLVACLATLVVRPESSPAPSFDIVIQVNDPANCVCAATVGHAISATSGCCPATPSVNPYIYVRTTSRSDSSCKVNPDNQCVDDQKSCEAKIEATVSFPSGACDTSGGATGPQIGTDASPCQTASQGGAPVTSTWTLKAKCKPGAAPSSVDGAGSLKFWCGGCSSGGQPPSQSPDLEFQPKLSCSVCQ
jgi:hypothetical protein